MALRRGIWRLLPLLDQPATPWLGSIADGALRGHATSPCASSEAIAESSGVAAAGTRAHFLPLIYGPNSKMQEARAFHTGPATFMSIELTSILEEELKHEKVRGWLLG
jgi:hypothetical protein